MGSVRVRYLVVRRRKSKKVHYWLPTPKLQEAGFLTRRLSDDPLDAAREAEVFNAELDRWYRGEAPPPKVKPGSLQALHELFQRDQAFGSALV